MILMSQSYIEGFMFVNVISNFDVSTYKTL